MAQAGKAGKAPDRLLVLAFDPVVVAVVAVVAEITGQLIWGREVRMIQPALMIGTAKAA